MPIQQLTDANGQLYSVVSTQEWQGSYGDGLRAQGYRYCGYGTYGIIVAAQGQPCFQSANAPPPPPPGPNIAPTVPPDTGAPAAPGVGSMPSGGCGCGEGAAPAVPVPGGPAAPSPVAPATMFVDRLRGLPWWVYVLMILVGAQLVGKDGR